MIEGNKDLLVLNYQKEEAKILLSAYKKVLESYNLLKDETEPEKFLSKLEKYNHNLKSFAYILNELNNRGAIFNNNKEKFKLLDEIF